MGLLTFSLALQPQAALIPKARMFYGVKGVRELEGKCFIASVVFVRVQLHRQRATMIWCTFFSPWDPRHVSWFALGITY